jgi:hypothetical protein
MSIQTTILAMAFTCVMAVGLWLRIIAKKGLQIMDGHLISITSDTMPASQTVLDSTQHK